jgi:biofilm PGA synthesis N-glycosyltransferase PgaC
MILTLLLTAAIGFIIAYPLIEIYRRRDFSAAVQTDIQLISKPVSVILVVYNEERDIERKIREILDEPIWNEGSELLIISGGSTDQTDDLIRSFLPDDRIKAHVFAENISKIESVNFAVSEARNELLIFTDCRQYMLPGSMPALLHKLESDQLDVVVATLHNKHDPKRSIRNTLNRMNLAKAMDSNSMNVYGALYAQRKSAHVVIPTDVLFDDLYVLAQTLARGKKIRQIGTAVLKDVNFEDYYREERIQRLTRGLMLFLFRHPGVVRKMSAQDRYHFLMSKYSKLVLPLVVAFLLLHLITDSLLHFSAINFNFLCLLLISLAGILNRNVRLFFRVVYYTLKAEYLYFMKQKRSVRWEKFTNY